jgi:hypothetical protein
VERVCDRVVFIERGRLTRTETLRGETASRRRTIVRVPPEKLEVARSVLAAEGIEAENGADATLRLAAGADADVARAVKVLAVADVPVLEVRSTAELEELFRPGNAS